MARFALFFLGVSAVAALTCEDQSRITAGGQMDVTNTAGSNTKITTTCAASEHCVSLAYTTETEGVKVGTQVQMCQPEAANCDLWKEAFDAGALVANEFQCNTCAEDNCNTMLENAGINAAGSTSVSGAVAAMALFLAARMAM
jgi:hypothetical protein